MGKKKNDGEQTIKEARQEYDEKKKIQQDFLVNKPPRIDEDLINHIYNVWVKFNEKLITRAPNEDESSRLAAYLTIAYFCSGGKMPPEKFYPLDLLPSIELSK